jgi:hypothetical protein
MNARKELRSASQTYYEVPWRHYQYKQAEDALFEPPELGETGDSNVEHAATGPGIDTVRFSGRTGNSAIWAVIPCSP